MRKSFWCRFGLHGWVFSHTSQERGVAVMNGQWVARQFEVNHYYCRFCPAQK